MAWFALLAAGLLEVVWAIGLKQTDGFSRLVPSVVTLVAMAASFGLLAYALKTLPVGTAYAVWTRPRHTHAINIFSESGGLPIMIHDPSIPLQQRPYDPQAISLAPRSFTGIIYHNHFL